MSTALGIDPIQFLCTKKLAPIEAVFNLAPQRHADAATANKFDYSRANWEASKNILINSSENECTVDELNEKLTTEILSAADQSIPVFTYVKKSSNLPPYIQAMIKKRKEIRARIRNTNQSADKTECNKIKKEIDIEIGKKIDLNWSNFMNKCGRSQQSLFGKESTTSDLIRQIKAHSYTHRHRKGQCFQ